MTNKESTILALLAKAEATDNEHERDAFNRKAEALMIKYSIEEAQLRAKASGQEMRKEAIVQERMKFYGPFCRGLPQMAWYITEALGGLKTLTFNPFEYAKGGAGAQRQDVKGLIVVGYESDVRRAVQLIRSLEIQAKSAVAIWWKNSPDRSWLGKQGAWRARRSFVVAFGGGAGERIKVVYGEAKRDVERETGSSTEVALRDRDAEVSAFVDAMSTGKGRSLKSGVASANQHGRAAGRKADVGGRGVSDGSNSSIER